MYRTFSHPNLINDYKFIAIVIILCLLGGCAEYVQTHEKASAISDAKISEGLAEAERLFNRRTETENLRNAVRAVSNIRNPDDRNFEVEWKFAKYSYFLGKAETDQSKAIEVFEKGRDAGRIATRLNKEAPDGYFWFGANLGELARLNPLTVGLKSVDEIREAMTKVVEIEPAYQGASAFDALGQLEMGTRLLKGGTAEKAVEFYEKGLSLAPDNSNIRVHLAEALIALRRDSEARKQLDAVISLKPNEEFVIEHAAAVKKARELLAKNF